VNEFPYPSEGGEESSMYPFFGTLRFVDCEDYCHCGDEHDSTHERAEDGESHPVTSENGPFMVVAGKLGKHGCIGDVHQGGGNSCRASHLCGEKRVLS